MVSAHPTIEHAAESIRRGAEDFVPVPYSEAVVRKEVARILEAAELRDRLSHIDRPIDAREGFARVISRSVRMRAVFDRANAAARSETPVLIVGETGTGKELIARAIHDLQPAPRPTVRAVNCAALPRDPVESELFGHESGAFTGADADASAASSRRTAAPCSWTRSASRHRRAGQAASRAAGAANPTARRHEAVASTSASSPRAIETWQAMRSTALREDLFLSACVFPIEIPPLRDRREDLPILIAHFLDAVRERGVHQVSGIEPAALDLLADYSFPGNIRELENLVEGLSVALPPDRSMIRAEDVRGWLRRRGLPVGD